MSAEISKELQVQDSSVEATQVNHTQLKNIVDHSRTTDSGMDEGSNSSVQDAGESDEEDVISRKPNKAKPRILDDDSDMSQDVPDSLSKKSKEYATAEDALDAVMNDSDEEGSDSESRQTTTPASVKKKVVRPVESDSSDDDDEEKQTLSEAVQNKKSEAVQHNKSEAVQHNKSEAVQHNKLEAVQHNKSEAVQNQKKDKVEEYATPEEALEAVLNNSSDDEGCSKKKGDQSDENQSDSDSDVKSSGSDRSDVEPADDEGFDESSIDPKLLAKLKKGAAKKAPREKRKSRREELGDIHSESQRIVRESRVNLPYHQPAPKSINDFLARAKSKQEQYKVLRGVRDRKAQVVEDILAKTRLKAQPKTQDELDKYSDSDEDWNPEDDREKSLKERLDERFGQAESSSVNVDKPGSSGEGIEARVPDTANSGAHTRDGDCDSLPDIDESQETKLDSISKLNNKQVMSTSEPVHLDSVEHMEEGESLRTEKTCPDETTIKETDVEKESISTASDSGTVTDHQSVDAAEALSQIDKEIESNSGELDNKDAHTKSSQMIDSSVKTGKGKIAALAGIDLDAVKPCLSGQFDSFISFEGEEKPTNPGVMKLMDRYCKHSVKQDKKHQKDRDISVISKDKTGMDTEELKLNTFTYHVASEEQNPLMKLDTPGAKLVALKEQLQGKIKAKREMARQVRQEAYDLDNEAGGMDADEEEAEMSDRSDTDVEDEEEIGDEEEEFDEGAEGDVEDEAEVEREPNPFADDEAEEEDDDEVSDDDDDDEDEEGMKLKLDVSDEEEEENKSEDGEEEIEEEERKKKAKVEKAVPKVKDKCPEFKEPLEKRIPEKPFSMFGGVSVSDSQFQSAQKTSSLVMPVEDSQDLYGNSCTLPDIAPTQGRPTQPGQSQDFSFFLEDSQSNMLDADGFLKTKSSVKKLALSALGDLAGTQDNMSDLLGLCSGRFVGTQETSAKEKISRKSLFDEGVTSTQGHMDDLVGLCSGVFTDVRSTQEEKKGTKRKVSEDSDDAIEAYSDTEERQSEKDQFSENEEAEGEEAGDTDQLDSDDEEGKREKKPTKFSGFTDKSQRGRFLKEFVDEEAELSGSEFDSDENLDLAEEDDIMEVEEGDKDMKNVDQDELRDEIGRVHMKQLIDEDKRELLKFQEMYLPDGDLYSEGAGRVRRFKWNNMDDDTQQDMFADGSDGEPEKEENENDFEWRKERYEREQFLKKQEEKESNEGENSQFLKFGKVFLKKQCSVDNSVSIKEKSGNPTKESENIEGIGSFYKLSKQKRGSFLARSKESLAKIAEKTKPIANPSAGAKTSGKFTFSVISPEKEKENVKESPAGKPRKAHVPKQKVPAIKKPPTKKPKLDAAASFTENSIFNHF